ncbi:PHP domain-containing protein [Candidatus Woesearchaeota archaeon]|nr:PHP domain-containing protein [Candidatus Woesearchaeota archaeon]
MLLKTDLHLHTSEDPIDTFITYSAKELIDEAEKKEFDVLSITLHDYLLDDLEIKEYAESKGILLIPGIEKKIEGKEFLLYNFTKEELSNINKIEDLKQIKKQHHLIIAPHPFYHGTSCLGNKLNEINEIIDGVEYCYFYTKYFNLNKKAEQFSKKYNKTLVASSDSHKLTNFGKNYSQVNSDKDINSVIEAIKEGNVLIKTEPLSIFQIFKELIQFKISFIKRLIKNVRTRN